MDDDCDPVIITSRGSDRSVPRHLGKALLGDKNEWTGVALGSEANSRSQIAVLGLARGQSVNETRNPSTSRTSVWPGFRSACSRTNKNFARTSSYSLKLPKHCLDSMLLCIGPTLQMSLPLASTVAQQLIPHTNLSTLQSRASSSIGKTTKKIWFVFI